MSKIEWTNVTWNPVTGCDKVSQGCKNCYAEIMHRRLRGMFPEKYSMPFLGHVQTHRDELIKPLTWKKSRMIFVNSMSDLFHSDVPFEFIRTVLGVISVCKQHTFQVLTKRPDRMLQFFQWLDMCDPDFQDDPANYAYDLCVEHGIETGCGSAFETDSWPLKNLWIGVSCEDQGTADQRIPLLLQIPAAVRFLSCEPLLGPLNIATWLKPTFCQYVNDTEGFSFTPLAWVIAGGESGHGARPMHPDWVRSLRDQCSAAGVPFFFKQWGQFIPSYQAGEMSDQVADYNQTFGNRWAKKSRSFPDGLQMVPVGKLKSGNFLDGKQHLAFPSTKIISHEDEN